MICQRCAKERDGVHTCTPSDLVRSLEQQRDDLLAALEPFAKLLQEHHDRMRDDQPIFGINSATILCGDLRRARAAIAKVKS